MFQRFLTNFVVAVTVVTYSLFHSGKAYIALWLIDLIHRIKKKANSTEMPFLKY